MKADEDNLDGLNYLEGKDVVVEENVNGSVHITATTVNITSNQIEGNLFIVAEEININSNIKGSAFLIANSINFNGEVYDLYTVSNNLNINSDSKCNSIKTISENLNIGGKVERSVYAISSNLNLVQNSNALVSGNVYCLGEVFGDKRKAENIEFYKDRQYYPILSTCGFINIYKKIVDKCKDEYEEYVVCDYTNYLYILLYSYFSPICGQIHDTASVSAYIVHTWHHWQ